MTTRTRAGIIITMTVMPLFLLATGSGGAREIVVDDDGGPWADHTAIQDAVNVSQDGDIVRVFAGQYDAAVILNRAVGLVGNGTKATFLTCTDPTASAIDPVIDIASDDVDMSDLSIVFGRYLINSFRLVGVRCEARDGLEVVGCDLIVQHRYDSGIGIVIGNCSRALMVDCTFMNNSQGIMAMNVSLELEGCTFEDEGDATFEGSGVNLEGCTFNSESDAFIKNSSMPLIRGCSFGADSRLNIADSIGSRIEECNFSDSGGSALGLHRADSSAIENCRFGKASGGMSQYQSSESRVVRFGWMLDL